MRILHSDVCAEGARLLERAIEEHSDYALLPTPVIRWGSTTPQPAGSKFVPNSLAFVRWCIDKLETLVTVREVIRTNHLLMDTVEYFPSTTTPATFPVIARTTLAGTRCEGMEEVFSLVAWRRKSTTYQWWSPKVASRAELRVMHYPAHPDASRRVALFYKRPVRNDNIFSIEAMSQSSGLLSPLQVATINQFCSAMATEYTVKFGANRVCAVGYDILVADRLIFLEANSGPWLGEQMAKDVVESAVECLRAEGRVEDDEGDSGWWDEDTTEGCDGEDEHEHEVPLVWEDNYESGVSVGVEQIKERFIRNQAKRTADYVAEITFLARHASLRGGV